MDIQQYKPARVPGVTAKEMLDGSGHHFMLKNSTVHSYARLSPEEFWVWEKLDGERTVQQLVLAYFMQYKAFAFVPIVALLERLREANMLGEPPRHLYADISAELKQPSILHKLTWAARTVFTKEFVIKNLDGYLDHIHHYGGWILFTLPVQILFFLVSVIGVTLFVILARQSQYNLLNLQTAIQLGLLAYIPLIIHEFGHAITAKHFGCEVYKGGALLYYGLPAAFVDTTDVWMFGKRVRLAVTWAGPYTGYIIGGTCSIIVYIFPNLPHAISVLLLQVALTSVFTTTFNILPLLKLDGYYLLADALEIPRLRERSMEFIAHQLRAKISKRDKWTRQEKIFLVFGILAILSTIYFTWMGVAFWDRQATKSISELLNLHGDFGALVRNIGIICIAASAIIYSLILVAGNVRQIVKWLQKKGLFSTRRRAALVVLIGALALTYLPRLLLPTLAVWFILLSGIGACALAAWLALSAFNSMRGSIHAGLWLTAAIGLLLGTGGGIGAVNAHWAEASARLHTAGIVLLFISFALAGRLLRGLQGSWREVSLALLFSGSVIWAASPFTSIELHTLAGLLILGSVVHWRMRPATQIKVVELETTESTHEKIHAALNEIKTTILSELELDFGKQTRVWVEKGIYRQRRRSADNAEMSGPAAGLTLDDYGGAMALALEVLLASVARAAGQTYAWRALAYGYDKLDWELQEISEDYLLKYVTYAKGLSIQLAATRDDQRMLLRSVPLFNSLTEEEISALRRRFVPARYRRGEAVVRAGDAGDTFYVIRVGRVEVLSPEGELLNNLGRGDYFGEAALLTNARRNATVRALTPLEVLVLNKSHFDKLLRTNVKFDEKARTEFHRLGLLRQIPLFEQFEGLELKLLASKLVKVGVEQNRTIFKQGEPGDRFCIIESGQVSVQIDGRERAILSAGEYFGEIALMMDTPRTATVTAIKPAVLLQLQADDFKELLRDSRSMKQALERASSRRTLSNARWARG